jgi:hypothetical protein
MSTQVSGALSQSLSRSGRSRPISLFPAALSTIRGFAGFFQKLRDAHAWAKEMDRRSRVAFPYISED